MSFASVTWSKEVYKIVNGTLFFLLVMLVVLGYSMPPIITFVSYPHPLSICQLLTLKQKLGLDEILFV